MSVLRWAGPTTPALGCCVAFASVPLGHASKISAIVGSFHVVYFSMGCCCGDTRSALTWELAPLALELPLAFAFLIASTSSPHCHQFLARLRWACFSLSPAFASTLVELLFLAFASLLVEILLVTPVFGTFVMGRSFKVPVSLR